MGLTDHITTLNNNNNNNRASVKKEGKLAWLNYMCCSVVEEREKKPKLGSRP